MNFKNRKEEEGFGGWGKGGGLLPLWRDWSLGRTSPGLLAAPPSLGETRHHLICYDSSGQLDRGAEPLQSGT